LARIGLNEETLGVLTSSIFDEYLVVQCSNGNFSYRSVLLAGAMVSFCFRSYSEDLSKEEVIFMSMDQNNSDNVAAKNGTIHVIDKVMMLLERHCYQL